MSAQGWVIFEDREGNLYGAACPDCRPVVEAQVGREQELEEQGTPQPAVPDVFPTSWERGSLMAAGDLTTPELIEAGYDPAKAERLDALRERARRFGGRVRVQRRGEHLGKQRYAFVVDLDPRGPHRLRSEEPQVAHSDLEGAEQHVVELEKRYGTV